MKTRVLTAVVLLPLLLLVLLVAPKLVTAILFGALCAVGAYELLYNTGLVRHFRLVIYSMVMAFLVAIWSFLDAPHAWAMIGCLLFFVAVFAEMMASHVKLHFDKAAMCMAAGLLVPYLLCAVVRIHGMTSGRHMVLIPFILSMCSDSGAYFAGKFLGRHKLAPVVSPNKTIEGVLGGLAAAVVGMLIYGLIMQLAMDYRVNYALAILYGFAGCLAGVFGDLCFSIIKRQTGIKDYGELIPGHGGILDRLDSMVLVAPLTEALLILLPLAEEVW